jgi:hypothetical protein
MSWLWVVGLAAIFALPAALIARLHAPPRDRDGNDTSDAAIEAERTRRHEFRWTHDQPPPASASWQVV